MTSRRGFLGWAGVALAAVALPRLPEFPDVAPTVPTPEPGPFDYVAAPGSCSVQYDVWLDQSGNVFTKRAGGIVPRDCVKIGGLDVVEVSGAYGTFTPGPVA